MISHLGRFEIKAEIGRGGFGQVFYSHDPLMNRVVAVKVLTATEDAGSFNRFKNEATAAGNLHHENIVTIYEFGHEGDIPFLVMEYLDGEDLLNVIKNKTPLSLYEKVRIMDRVADGLHCAHRNGVLHRDIKPANIMLLKTGGVKIMDFGIARLTRDASTRLTQPGYLIGTVVYMAPELFETAIQVDALCDIWSYGVVMYELLSGTNPFHTGSMQSEMYRIVHHNPPPLPPEICPPDLQAVVGKLLTREREFRYQTLEETRFDLQPILLNLKKVEADRLVSVAQQLMFQGQWTEALEPVRAARKMDPQNGTARIIFDHIQDQLRKQTARPRIDDLLRRSNEAAGQRKITEAISHLDSVIGIDPTNEEALSRLQELRSRKQKIEEAAKLLSESGNEFRTGSLTDAFEHASEAVSLDPENQEGKRLFESIQGALRDREGERALEAEILRARGLMAIDDLDGAMQTLKTAESNYPGRRAVRDLTAQISARIAERQQRLEFTGRLDRAKGAVRSGRFVEAIQELEQLLAAAPKEGEVADLLAYAKQEIAVRGRGEELNRITSAATELCRKQEFCEAIQILEDGLKKYPDDLALTRLLRSTHRDLQNSQREEALRTSLERCEDLRRSGKWQEALNLLALLISDNPNSRELAALDVKIRQEKIQGERAGFVRIAVEEAEKLLRNGQPEAAVKVLQSASREAGPDPEITALLKKAEEAHRAERDRQYVESELKHAKVFEEKGDIATSLKIIDDALRRSPKSPELLATRARLNAAGVSVQAEPEIAAPPAPAAAGLVDRKKPAKSDAKSDDATTLFAPGGVAAQPVARPAARQVEQSGQSLPSENVRPKPKWWIYGSAGLMLIGFAGLAIWLHQPGITVSPEKLSFAGADPAPQTITVTGASKIATPRTHADWLSVTRGQNSSDKTEFKVQVLPGSLKPGTYTELLAFLPDKKVSVDFVVPAGLNGLEIKPASLTFPSSPAGTPGQKILVTSSAEIFGPKPSENWLTVTRRNIGAGKAEFLVQVSPNGLPPGLHTAFLTFPSGQKVPVELIIAGGSTIAVYPRLLAFPGGGAQQRVTFLGPGDIPDPVASESWVTVTRGNVSPGKAEFLVQTSASELEAGKYNATLTFPDDKKVQVELTVAEDPGALEVKPESLALSTATLQQTITVTGPGEIPNPTVTDPWLKFKRRDLGAGIAEFDVQGVPAGLAVGPHVAYLNFTSIKKVRVVLTVAPK